MVRAGAMIYAIVFTLLIGVFALTFLWIVAGNRLIEVKINNRERVLLNVFSAAEYAQRSDLIADTMEYLVLINSDSCFIKKNKWGLLNAYTIKALKNEYELKRAYLSIDGIRVGEISKEAPTLYITDNDYALKIAGQTQLKGNLYLPKRGIGRAHFEGKFFSGDQLFVGTKHVSSKKLPELHDKFKLFDVHWWLDQQNVNLLEYLPEDSMFLFSTQTALYESINPIFIENQNCFGNIVIHSYDSITVSSTSNLENVILISPVIRFEEGFKGNVQAFAEERIILEDNVQLLYPSILMLKDKDEGFRRSIDARIEIGESSIFLGSVIMTTSSHDYLIPEKLLLQSGSYVVGAIYNEGVTDVKGTVIGTLFTKSFLLETKSSKYINHLVDAKIDGTALPTFFVMPDFFETTSSKDHLVKWLE